MISDKEGKFLISLARKAIERYIKESESVKPPKDLDKKFYQNSGVFVTLNKISQNNRELRGCIGYPHPERPLLEALIDAAISSATRDPRFERLHPEELEKIVVEVSVLTPPERVIVSSPKEYPKHINVGEDGLIVKWRLGSGLLLPQVAVEYGWNAEDFLCHTCIKAGAPPDLWLTPDSEIQKFKAIIFSEVSPRGHISRR